MPTNDQIKLIRYLLGVNRRDGGDLVKDNQFYSLQNWYPKTKGVLYKREGTTPDIQSSDIPGASVINSIWRHHNYGGQKSTLYHCKPTATPLPTPSALDLTLTDVSAPDGNIFNGGGVLPIRVAYSWAGLGQESSYNWGQMPLYDNTANIHSWAQPAGAVQSITLGANTNYLDIRVPLSFPSGVRICNVFATVGNLNDLVFIGQARQGDTIRLKRWIAGVAAIADPIDGTLTVTPSSFSGLLPPGQYYIGLAWVCDNNLPTNANGVPVKPSGVKIGKTQAITLRQGESSIDVKYLHGSAGSVPGGAKSLYVFISRQDHDKGPMAFAGIINNQNEVLSISTQQFAGNRQTSPVNKGGGTATESWFHNYCLSTSVTQKARSGFVMRWDETYALFFEVFMSFTAQHIENFFDFDPVNPFSGVVDAAPNRYHRDMSLRTDVDRDSSGTLVTNSTAYSDPYWAYYGGYSYFTNGLNVPFQTDGFTMAPMVEKWGTILPPVGRYISVFKDSLCLAGADARNQVYYTVATEPNRWTTSGSALNFVTIGDPFGDAATAIGSFSLTTVDSGPKSYFLACKANTIWGTSSLVGNAPLENVSGKVGCTAYKSMKITNIGTVFLGTDGVIYLIRGAGEPFPIGQAVQPIFAHLVSNGALMKKVTACFHEGFYKIAYPSSSTSTYNDAQMFLDCRTEDGSPTAWYGPHTGVAVGDQLVFSGENDTGYRMACLASGVGTVRLDNPATYQDLGVNIVSTMEWKTSRFGAEMHRKRYMGMSFDAYYDTIYAHEIMVEAFADDQYTQQDRVLSTGTAVWDAAAFDSGLWGNADYSDLNVSFGQDNLVGRTFKWKLTHSNNAQMIIAAVGILYKPERRMII